MQRRFGWPHAEKTATENEAALTAPVEKAMRLVVMYMYKPTCPAMSEQYPFDHDDGSHVEACYGDKNGESCRNVSRHTPRKVTPDDPATSSEVVQTLAEHLPSTPRLGPNPVNLGAQMLASSGQHLGPHMVNSAPTSAPRLAHLGFQCQYARRCQDISRTTLRSPGRDRWG